MKVIVMAGTFIDTEMGVKIVEKEGYDTISCPVSKSPEEQDQLQFLSPEALLEKVLMLVKKAKKEGGEILFLYCNSLSSVLPLDTLQKSIKIPVITPFDSYKKLGKDYSDIVILAANSIATQKIELALKETNKEVSILSIGYLELVNNIERYKEKDKIIGESKLEAFFEFLNQLPKKTKRGILLGCTHFPFLKKEMQEFSKELILDPVEPMLDLLKKYKK